MDQCVNVSVSELIWWYEPRSFHGIFADCRIPRIMTNARISPVNEVISMKRREHEIFLCLSRHKLDKNKMSTLSIISGLISFCHKKFGNLGLLRAGGS